MLVSVELYIPPPAGPYLKRSGNQAEAQHPFVPTNLHHHRLSARAASWPPDKPPAVHDIFSCAAFTAGSLGNQPARSRGLIRYRQGD